MKPKRDETAQPALRETSRRSRRECLASGRSSRGRVGLLAALAAMSVVLAGLAPAGDAQEDMPQIIPDESASDWVVDRFAGNSAAGPMFFQGPAREAGGLGRCGACPLPDGRVLVPFPDGLAEVDADGTLRLLTTDTAFVGTTLQMTAAVAAWNPADKHAYFGKGSCLGRLIERADGPCEIEVVAGTPGTPGFTDGPLKDATFTRIESVVINSRGGIFVLDASQRLRKVENGQVTTLTAACRAGGGPVDGPLDKARFCLTGLGGNLCGGEDDDTLYLSDHWNFAVRRIDLKTMTVSTVAGLPKPKEWQPAKQTAREQRYNRNCDEPALTWASFNSGCAYVCWDPFHKEPAGVQSRLPNWLDMGKAKAKGDTWPWGESASAFDGQHSVVVWQRHHLCGEKMTNFENCDLIAARVDGYKPLDAAGVAVAASAAEERRPAVASDGVGRLLMVYEKQQGAGAVSVMGRMLQSK